MKRTQQYYNKTTNKKQKVNVEQTLDTEFNTISSALFNKENDLLALLHKSCDNGDLTVLAQCFDSYPLLMNKIINKPYQNKTAISRAIINANLEVLKLLKTNGADLNQLVDGLPSYYYAFKNEQFLRKVIELNTIDNTRVDENSAAALYFAIRLKKFNILSLLLEYDDFRQHINSRVIKEANCTPLHIALAEGHPEAVEILVHHKVNPIIDLGDKVYPIHIASAEGNLNCLELLVDYLPNFTNLPTHLLEKTTKSKYNCLHYCSHKRNLECLQYLLRLATEMNIVDELTTAKSIAGYTPIHVAIIMNHNDCVKELLGYYKDFSTIYHEPFNIISFASENSQFQTFAMIIKHLELNSDPSIKENDSSLFPDIRAPSYVVSEKLRGVLNMLINDEVSLPVGLKNFQPESLHSVIMLIGVIQQGFMERKEVVQDGDDIWCKFPQISLDLENLKSSLFPILRSISDTLSSSGCFVYINDSLELLLSPSFFYSLNDSKKKEILQKIGFLMGITFLFFSLPLQLSSKCFDLIYENDNHFCKIENLNRFDEIDTEFKENLEKLKTLKKEEFEELNLTFEVATYDPFSTYKLIENGDNIFVNAENFPLYQSLYLKYRREQIRELYRYFVDGFLEVVPSNFALLFTSREISHVISGKYSC